MAFEEVKEKQKRIKKQKLEGVEVEDHQVVEEVELEGVEEVKKLEVKEEQGVDFLQGIKEDFIERHYEVEVKVYVTTIVKVMEVKYYLKDHQNMGAQILQKNKEQGITQVTKENLIIIKYAKIKGKAQEVKQKDEERQKNELQDQGQRGYY